MKRYALSLVILGIVTSLIGSVALWLHVDEVFLFSSDEAVTDFYMLLDSCSKFAVVLAFYISLSERSILKMLVFVASLFAFGEIMDELIFDPCKMQLNEILLIIIALIYVVIYGRKTLHNQ